MALKTASRTSQNVMCASFEFDITDTMVDTSSATTAFSAAAGIFDVIKLPPDSTVVAGSLIVVTASNDSSTATIKIGDSSDDDRYLAATNLKAAARTVLVPTGFRNSSALPVRITFANAGADATAGTVRIEVQYIVQDRANEVQPY